MINASTHYLNQDGHVSFIPRKFTERHQDSPLCTIVIPCFNYGEYLPEAVESALQQTLPSIEVIIIDDGSTDPLTLDVVKSYQYDPRIRVIMQKNAGLTSTRNAGIAVAKGKYICCLDADDILSPSYIEKCLHEFETHLNIGFVCSWVQYFGDESQVWQTRNFDIDEALIDNFTCGAAVFRCADWKLVGGYDSRMVEGYEDWEFWLRIAQLGRAGKALTEPLYHYRRHGETMLHRAHKVRSQLIARIHQFNRRLFEDSHWLATVRKYCNDLVSCIEIEN